MRVEFLGSGGAITTPKPGCNCRVCAEAREKGVPYSRSGPSLFVHGPDILIDTPEEIKEQLNRSGVSHIEACFYSHWHPDHVMGRRIWEMNKDWRGLPHQNRRTDIYLPQQVARDFGERLGTWDHLDYLERQGLVRLIQLQDGDVVSIDGTEVQPFRLAEAYVYGFVFENYTDEEGQGRRLLIVPDELPVLRHEATFRETLDVVRKLDAGRIVLTHIEEPDGLSYADLIRLEEQLAGRGIELSFAYDTLVIDV
jgi:phosphoribosyl 1,2-cyclic phosphate phosphodiesterase